MKIHILYVSLIIGIMVVFNNFIITATKHDEFIEYSFEYIFRHLGDPVKK